MPSDLICYGWSRITRPNGFSFLECLVALERGHRVPKQQEECL